MKSGSRTPPSAAFIPNTATCVTKFPWTAGGFPPRTSLNAGAWSFSSLGGGTNVSANDKRAITMFGREEFKPIMEGITIGIEALLFFIGAMTLGIGGVGVMNIMLVSVEERVREIGLRRALGARKAHIRSQFLLEALVMTLAAGGICMLLSLGLTFALGPPPVLGPAYGDEFGKVDI